MAADAGFEAHAIADYVADKSRVRQGIAERVRIAVPEVKTCLIALVYGARRSAREVDAIPEVIGCQAAQRLYADPVFAALQHDISRSRRVILQADPTRGKQLVNAMGLALPLPAAPTKRLAHLTQGVEAQALRAMQAVYPDEIVLLMHDGFVSRCQLDRMQLSRAVWKATGYEFKLSEKQLDGAV